MRSHRHISALLLPMLIALVLSSCLDPFNVNVTTDEPVKVDLSMDVHVYQHAAATTEKESAQQADYRAAMDTKRNRMAEIQEMKNSRIIGENHLGKISIRNKPAGEYGDYVTKTVDAENRDRDVLIKHEAKEKDVSITNVQQEQWRHWQRKSFPGEWIEVEEAGGSGLHWEQKASASDSTE
ncbi:YdbL family protein [Verrucomicrobiales bacterium]|nr:YdbL family protein [Verrucomicrobiales bacterium]